MPSTSSSAAAPSAVARLGFYYGRGDLDALDGLDAVVLQPGYHDPAELARLARRGVRPLAYLSVGEDPGPSAPWQRSARNPDWGAAYVRASHPGWRQELGALARDALRVGFQGLLLDTLDAVELYPEDRPALLALVARLGALLGRGWKARPGTLLANRGFALLPELAGLVDGMVFEAFSATWTQDGCRPVSAATLHRNAELAHGARSLGVPLYALDYADAPLLAAFARRRAELHGLTPILARDRALTLPG